MRDKINKFILLFIFICTMVLIVNGNFQNPLNYDELRNKVFNLLNTKSSYNSIYNNFVYFTPSGFNKEIYDSQVRLVNHEADILIHFGTGNEVNDKFYINVNKDKVKEYEDIDEDNNYFFVWEYDKTHKLVMIGKNDRYVEGIVNDHQQDKYLLLIATIYSSIKEVEA